MIVIKFGDFFIKVSKDLGEFDMEFFFVEFRGWFYDFDLYIIFFKCKGREFWVFDYKNFCVVFYRIWKRKYKDEDIGEEVEEEFVVYDRIVFNFVFVVIREVYDFIIELVVEEVNMDVLILYWWVIVERVFLGIYI